jgi:hypothetical protein
MKERRSLAVQIHFLDYFIYLWQTSYKNTSFHGVRPLVLALLFLPRLRWYLFFSVDTIYDTLSGGLSLTTNSTLRYTPPNKRGSYHYINL